MKYSIETRKTTVTAAQAHLRLVELNTLALATLALAIGLGSTDVAFAQPGTAGSSTNGAADPGSSSSPGTAAKQQGSVADNYDLAMDGFCPVCILDMKKWVRGDRRFSVALDGKLYLFPGEEQKQKFLKNVVKYSPALSGDCIVCYVDAKARMPGSVHSTVIHNGRLFMFPSQDEKDKFMQNPKKYENADLAFGGMCGVCRVEMQQNVPGKPEFGMVYKGKSYLFPSQKEKSMFLKQPTKYAQ